ncbi:MAG: 2-methylcitrate dehydratase [Acidobacteria bacterium RIFCSPLOWO2_12_FULL_68_19]|nr:MAG: 2-methylcitrate dehydratase [Acidobacteria bacterium RIFCSPLOWO2_12_FULL_68_19]
MTTVAETLAAHLAAVEVDRLPADTVETARKLCLDVAGLCVAARREPYVAATLSAIEPVGPCTAFGHAGAFEAFGAALVNGTAAHGEDFDDTFEGGPVHSGAVIVPAVLAACEREGLGGERFLLGVVTGTELLCRLGLVAPMATHNAGFHPTAVFGALAAAGAVSAALGLPPGAAVSALGIGGSMASGIIEYLAEGTWTKRMHAGWAAQSGLRAALMARAGFVGPRTVFEGRHGLYHAFAPSVAPDFAPLLDGLGRRWVMPSVAFKPYACGTMTQPFIDCARRLAEGGVRAGEIREIVCEVADGTVPRLWEPLAAKHRPPTPYAAKFSTPFCIAVGFIDGRAGLAQFTEARVHDSAVLALASKVRYTVNPLDQYPRTFTGHLRAVLHDGTEREYRQPHMRGGSEAPLSLAELEAKFADNARHGGWTEAKAERFLELSRTLFAQPTLEALKEFRA